MWLGFLVPLVIPSPKCHSHEVGEFVDVSVNWMACPVAGDAGLKVNEAEEAEGVTVTVRLTFLEAVPLLAVRLTLWKSGVENAWLGFCSALVVPSPKSHCQEARPAGEESVNCTFCPTVGYEGLYVKDT